ncbi:MAG: ABC transporter permease [Muribaculaceae bacterium]|nr:ABC transporter permease [Muribaculaceae bacterium]
MSAFTDSLRLGVARLASRRLYIFAMAVVPLLTTVFFVSLMHSGLPLRTPVGIVDNDLSPSSRKVTRMLNAEELLDIRYHYDSFEEAMAAVRTGESFGFFLIPENFERDAVAGKNPSLSLFTNMSFFVPGTLSFKGFKTGAVLTSGSLAQTKFTAVGMTDRATQAMLQPVVVDTNAIGNPWTNYNYYLTNSFMPALLQLMILLLTVFTITEEIKTGRSVEWLRTADGSILRALAGKLLPQTLVWLLTGMAMLGMLFGFFDFPLNCSIWTMAGAMALMVVASQAMGVFMASILPNPRLGLSLAALTGILTFSVAAFSFPVASMYGSLAIFSYILPVRYYFLIYVNQALNGLPVYYSRYFFAALIAFPLVASTLLWRLRKACLKPVYVP